MTLADVEEIIRNALGLKPTDALKVVDARFHAAAAPLAEEEENPWPKYMALAQHLSLGMVALCAVAVFRIFSRARGKAATETAGAPSQGGGPAGLLLSGEPSDPMVARQQIARALKQNPQQVRQMFLNWIEEKE
jgi:flagellar biosynthesis/type III secretory pathway M-ring protein FliF/YscJ